MQFMEHIKFRGYDDEWGLNVVLTKKKIKLIFDRILKIYKNGFFY